MLLPRALFLSRSPHPSLIPLLPIIHPCHCNKLIFILKWSLLLNKVESMGPILAFEQTQNKTSKNDRTNGCLTAVSQLGQRKWFILIYTSCRSQTRYDARAFQTDMTKLHLDRQDPALTRVRHCCTNK